MKRLALAVAVLAGIFGWSLASQAAAPPPQQRFERPFQKHELLQPAYPWRQPGSGGKLRLLILAHSWTTVEFAEFAKRFDCEYDLIPIWSENFLDRAWETPESRTLWREITGLLTEKPYDAILVSSYGNFPPQVWAAIYRKCLETRAGLLLFNSGGAYSQMPEQMKKDGFLTGPEKLDAAPLTGVDWTGCYEENYPVDAAGRLGDMTTAEYPLSGKVQFYAKSTRCRTVLFNWPQEPYAYWAIQHGITPAGLYFPYGRVYPMAEHIFALAGKALQWAANRPAPVQILEVLPGGGNVTGPAPVLFRCTLANPAGGDCTVTLDWEVRDENNFQLLAGVRSTAIAAGEMQLGLELGSVPASGQHLYFRGRLLLNDRVIDWAAAHVQVQFPETDWTFAVPNRDRNAPEQPFQAEVEIKSPGKDDTVRVNLFDSWNRLIRRAELRATAGRNSLPLQLQDTSGIVYRLQAQWRRQDQLLGQKEIFATVQRIPQQRFFAIRSDANASTVTGWYLAQLNRLYGINYYRTPGAPASTDALFGAGFGVYTYNGRINGPIKPDAEMEKTYEDFLKNDVLPVKPYGASLYDCGDDTGLGTGLFQSTAKTAAAKTTEESADWQRFIAYLKTVYPTPAELAASWQVPVTAFTDVSREQLLEQQKSGNLVPLLDYRQYQEWLYAKHLRQIRTLAREQTPWAKVTINGYGDLGLNLESVAAEVDSLVPYYRPYHLRELRGLLGRGKSLGTVTGAYYGEQTDRRFLAFIPWETVLLGGNVVWLWGQGCIAGDGGFADSTYPLFESTRELAAGIGELLAAADWQNEGVYILSCPHSSHAQEMGAKFGVASNVRETFAALLEELQTGYDFIGCATVAAGELPTRKAKVLFLPYAVGLEPAAQEQIRNFVKNGGTVIADFRPATRTPRGRPLAAGGLDDLFGVKAVAVPEPVARGALPGLAIETMADRVTTLAEGKAGGTVSGTPVLIANRSGGGRTLLLNCSLSRYRPLLAAGQGAELTAWLAAALKNAGVEIQPYGKLPPGTKVFHYRRGDNRYLAVYREDVPGQPERCRLRLPLPDKPWIQDVRHGGSLGQPGILELDCGKLEAQLFLVSSRPPTPFTLAAEKVQIRPGDVAACQILAPGGEERLFRFDLRDPLGNPYPETGRLQWTRQGRLDLRWSCAVNDSPGVYSATVTDVETGQQWQTGIQVAGEPMNQTVTTASGGVK